MRVSYTYKNLAKNEEAEVKEYVEQKLDTFEHLLSSMESDMCLLNVICEKFEKHDAFKIEFHMKISGKNIISSETSHAYTKAIDDSKDRLVQQIKKHLALQKDRTHKTIRSKEVIHELVQS